MDWDALIAEVVERGKEVPEVDWAIPGEDAAEEVRHNQAGCDMFVCAEDKQPWVMSMHFERRMWPSCIPVSVWGAMLA